MKFKEKLVILRKSRGLTQDEFASAIGVSRQAVYKWECGQSYPEVPKLLEMKVLFTISIDELLDDNYDIPIPEKKKRKRISKEAIAKIEESVKSEIVEKKIPEVKPVTPIRTTVNTAPKAEPARVKIEIPKVVEIQRQEPKEENIAKEIKVNIPSPEEISVPTTTITVEDTIENDDDSKKGGFFSRIFGKR